jgi:hypothetical protein
MDLTYPSFGHYLINILMKKYFLSLFHVVAGIFNHWISGKASHLMICSFIVLLFSCNLSSNMEEVQPKAEKMALYPGGIGGPIFSHAISFHRVDIFTSTSDAISGTVTMEIRNADGSVVYGSRTVFANNLVKGHMKKNTFVFSPALTLNSGQKYRIYFIRSNPHNYLNDHIAWRSSNGGTDVYPKGTCYFHNSVPFDLSFVTYSDGYVDQQQTSSVYGFAIGNTYAAWQEFVPSKIWVIQP